MTRPRAALQYVTSHSSAAAERRLNPATPSQDPDTETPELSPLPPDAFWRAFERRYGAHASYASTSVRRFLYPRLAADFATVEAYRLHRGGKEGLAEALPCPLAAMAAHVRPSLALCIMLRCYYGPSLLVAL